jgi:hypothetical protein
MKFIVNVPRLASSRRFPIFPYLYLIVPWSQFLPTGKRRSDIALRLIGLECSAS